MGERARDGRRNGDREREGANVWFTLPSDHNGALARDLIARLPPNDPTLEADRRQAARVREDAVARGEG